MPTKHESNNKNSFNPLISVIVPVYNVREFLPECADSILAQTYDNLEIILIDDGSTDGSSKLCDELKLSDKRIKVFHQKNAGLSAARNVGIKEAKGDYIAFIDSDDSIKPNYIELLYKTAHRNNSDISVCGYNDDIPEEGTVTGKEATIRLLLRQENIDILAWNKLYNKSLFRENHIEYPNGKIHEDNLTTYKLYSCSNRVSFMAESLYKYRKREGSITKEDKKETHLKVREQAAKEAISFFNDDKDIKAAAEISLLLAKYAFLDNALSGKIDKTYISNTTKWLKKHKDDFRNNQFLSTKHKLYLILTTNCNSIGYKLFRKFIHE